MGKKKKRCRITEVASSIFSSSTVASKSGNTLHRSFTIQPNSSDLSIVEVDEPDTRTLRKKYVLKHMLLDLREKRKERKHVLILG